MIGRWWASRIINAIRLAVPSSRRSDEVYAKYNGLGAFIERSYTILYVAPEPTGSTDGSGVT